MSSSVSALAALQQAIDDLQAHRATLGDGLVDAALAPLLERLATLSAQPDPAAAAEPGRRLRQVSVLFLDLVGSTQLIQQLDPEEVQAVVDGALRAFTAIVRRHGGEVLRYAGDNVKAAFGANGTREDDAERAVHCGLALLQEAAHQGAQVRQVHGHAGFDARVGIHTGPVVRGGGIEQNNSLSGLAVNVAARMEQAAPAGSLRISQDTYRLVQGNFDVQEQPALIVKGLNEPMRTYLVLAEKERSLRGLRQGLEGVVSPLQGRARELAQLQALAGQVFERGGLATATVMAEAGLGKSRLLAEFESGLRADTRSGAMWKARGHPQGRLQPFGLLRDLLFRFHGVKDSDSQELAQRKWLAGLSPWLGDSASEQAAMLGQLIGLDFRTSPYVAGILGDGRQLRARGLHALAEYLRAQAAVQPLVLLLDDLHWADDESLAAIDHLMAAAADLPLLLVMAARPELLQRRPAWADSPASSLHLKLQALGDSGGQALAASLLQRLAVPSPQLQALLVEQAAGNPYYMEALVQMLLDTQVIQQQDGQWRVQQPQLQALRVPSTLVGVLQATLDALSAGERLSLQLASVVGAQFWDESLAAIDATAPAQLPQLAQYELALPLAHSTFEGTRAYAFRHHLLHQVTYGTVLKADKREGHRRTAMWLQGRSIGRESELATLLAEHFERADEYGPAVDNWLLAAENASRRQADSAALAHADRGLALDDGSDLRRLARLHRVRMDVFVRTGRMDEHGQVVGVLEELAERLNDDVLRLLLAKDRLYALCLAARFEEAVALGTARLAAAEASAPGDAARAHNLMFIALSRLGRFDEAMAHADQGLAQARAAGDFNTEGAILNNVATNHLDARRMALARTLYAEALRAYDAAGSRYGACTVHLNLALIDDRLGRPAPSRDALLQVLPVCQAIGHRLLECQAHSNLAASQCELDEHLQAYDSALRGLRLAQAVGDRLVQTQALTAACQAAQALGRLTEALDCARQAVEGYKLHGQKENAWDSWATAITLRTALGEPLEALQEVAPLLQDVAAQGGWGDSIIARTLLHELLAPLGDPRSAGLLAGAYATLQAEAAGLAEFVSTEAYMQSTVLRRRLCALWAAAQPA